MQTLDLSKIGASDVGMLLGLDEYREPIDLYQRIVHGVEVGASDWLQEAGDLGRTLEHGIADVLCRRRLGFEPFLLQPPSRTPADREWQRYSLDFVTDVYFNADNGHIFPCSLRPSQEPRQLILEIKLRNRHSVDSQEWGTPGTGDVALGVMAQVQAQLDAVSADRDFWEGTDVPDLGEVQVGLCVDGQEIRHYVVKRNPEMGALIREEAERFWKDHVQARVPPPLEYGQGTVRELMRRHPVSSKAKRAATAEESALATELLALKNGIKNLEERELELQIKLCESIGRDYGIESEAFSAVWFEKESLRWGELLKHLQPDPALLEAAKLKFKSAPKREFKITARKAKEKAA